MDQRVRRTRFDLWPSGVPTQLLCTTGPERRSEKIASWAEPPSVKADGSAGTGEASAPHFRRRREAVRTSDRVSTSPLTRIKIPVGRRRLIEGTLSRKSIHAHRPDMAHRLRNRRFADRHLARRGRHRTCRRQVPRREVVTARDEVGGLWMCTTTAVARSW